MVTDLIDKYLGEMAVLAKVNTPKKGVTVMKGKVGKVNIHFLSDDMGAVVNLSVGNAQSTKMQVKNAEEAEKLIAKHKFALAKVKNNKELLTALDTVKTKHGRSN